ncbi:MAG: hypothetical protein SPJ57_07430 [Candidatus Methanomethylophilaceae archaeon]|nr:hypothetical protein [Candidatus Methanomethylophilaceae archaeon]
MESQVRLLVMVSTVAVAVFAVAGGILLYGSLSDKTDDSDAISYISDWKDYAEKLDQYGGYIIRTGIDPQEAGYSSTTRVSYRITVSAEDVVTLKGDLLEVKKNEQSYTYGSPTTSYDSYYAIPLSQIQMIHYRVTSSNNS